MMLNKIHPNTKILVGGYFFTQEQLNDYTTNVIKQALDTAANNVELDYGKGRCRECGSDKINEQSITNTFEETFKKFEV